MTDRKALCSRWLSDEALPLWSGIGIDTATGTAWEALDHTGAPCPDMDRRLRVQARQAYCFASSGTPAHLPLAQQLFAFAMGRGFDPVTGNLAAYLNPDTSINTAPHDLYDLAFMLLALAALGDAGCDITADLAHLETALARLKAPRGWHENARRTLPRRQNPHMHMFEATTALYHTTGQARFRDMADECLGLFRDVFFQTDGRILEYFDADWHPLAVDKQTIEPGHMAEWIYLLDRYETVTGATTNVDLDLLFNAVVTRRDVAGFLPDRAEPANDPACQTRRMWPQTELLKATVVMQRRGAVLDPNMAPDAVFDLLWHDYLTTQTPGGWYDKRAIDGTLLSDTMPASTFYHILCALRFYANDGRVD